MIVHLNKEPFESEDNSIHLIKLPVVEHTVSFMPNAGCCVTLRWPGRLKIPARKTLHMSDLW